MSGSAIMAVVPSLSVKRIDQLTSIVRVLDALQVATVVVANGRLLDVALESAGVRKMGQHRNLGFGAAINYAAQADNEWNWLLLVNDDVVLDPVKFGAAIEKALTAVTRPTIVYFDHSAPKRVPSASDVFRGLALLDGVKKVLTRAGAFRTALPPSTQTYKAFSIVAISREAWEMNSGFDERFGFTYEDSDFVRRAYAANFDFVSAEAAGAEHLHSETGRHYIDSVLPVSAWSGYQYLVKWGMVESAARATCIAALVVRIPLILFVRGSRLRHLIGDARAISALARNVAPLLPDYWSV